MVLDTWTEPIITENISEETITSVLNITSTCSVNGTIIARDLEEIHPGIRIVLMTILCILFLVCFFGNLLTITTLTYIRSKCSHEFTTLKGACVLLLVNLSICDLLYGLIGFPHFFHYLMNEGTNPFPDSKSGKTVCYLLAMFRNLFAQADFATMGAIAFMACRQKLCQQCSESGQYANHDSHDKLFQKRGIILIIILTWFISFISISPDCIGLTGGYIWSNTFYGCDVVYYCGKKSYGMMINIILNVIIITYSYFRYSMKLMSECKAASAEVPEVPEQQRMFNQDMKMLMTLALAYTLCVLPTSLLCWGQFDIDSWFNEMKDEKHVFKSFFNVLYWSMYSMNFLLYLASFSRMREAYKRFLTDMKQKVWKRKASILSHSSSIQHISRLREPNSLD